MSSYDNVDYYKESPGLELCVPGAVLRISPFGTEGRLS